MRHIDAAYCYICRTFRGLSVLQNDSPVARGQHRSMWAAYALGEEYVCMYVCMSASQVRLLPARRYAIEGTSYGLVSVCLSVCLSVTSR